MPFLPPNQQCQGTEGTYLLTLTCLNFDNYFSAASRCCMRVLLLLLAVWDVCWQVRAFWRPDWDSEEVPLRHTLLQPGRCDALSTPTGTVHHSAHPATGRQVLLTVCFIDIQGAQKYILMNTGIARNCSIRIFIFLWLFTRFVITFLKIQLIFITISRN